MDILCSKTARYSFLRRINNVFLFNPVLELGVLQPDILTEERRREVFSLLDDEWGYRPWPTKRDWRRLRRVHRKIQRALKKDPDVRIWCCRDTGECLLLYYFCWLLKDMPVRLYTIQPSENGAVADNWMDSDFAETLAARDKAQPLSREEIRAFANQWEALLGAGKPLRRREGDDIVSAEVDCFDDVICGYISGDTVDVDDVVKQLIREHGWFYAYTPFVDSRVAKVLRAAGYRRGEEKSPEDVQRSPGALLYSCYYVK